MGSNALIKNFKGKYRLKANYDKRTNDFPRNEKFGMEKNDDIFIYCGRGDEIYHYGRSVYRAYITSPQRARRVLKELGEDNISIVQSGSIEAVIEFKRDMVDAVAVILKARISGASISPFSPKNLPHEKYNIPEKDNITLKETLEKKLGEELTISSYQKIGNIYTKFGKYKKLDLVKNARLNKLKPKEYIHSLGLWSELITYISKCKLQ